MKMKKQMRIFNFNEIKSKILLQTKKVQRISITKIIIFQFSFYSHELFLKEQYFTLQLRVNLSGFIFTTESNSKI